MTDIKIDTAADLESFLKILAEESVSSSKLQLSENVSGDSVYQKDLTARIKKDKSRFDEADDEAGAEIDDVGSEESDQDAQSPPPEEDTDDSSASKEDINYYSIRNIINQIRAGDSTRDSEVAEPLEQYIMSDLSDEERELMHTFFLSVANIMNKTGQGPQDPSDPPTSINVSKDSKKSPSLPDDSQKSSQTKRDSPASPAASAQGKEDIRPPIQVGSQMKENIRRKVLDLMKV